MKRLVMHVDMDAFFASVEQREHLEYRGKPVIVAGLSGRGVVSTCSYEARRFGVHSAMPTEKARRLCPQGIFVEGNHKLYQEVSGRVFEIFSRYSPVVEPLSIDEAFLDLTGMDRLMKSPQAYAGKLKQEILEKTGLVASVGIAPNKFLAKLASDLKKPNGLVIIAPEQVDEILRPLPVSRIWGVGHRTEEQLRRMRCDTIGKLQKQSLPALQKAFGEKQAQQLYNLSRGIDFRPVMEREEAKSIGKEITFEEDLQCAQDAEAVLLFLSEQVGWRMRKAGVKARTIQLKLRRGDFTTLTRSRTLLEATCYDEEIYHAAQELYHALGIPRGIRLLGVTGTNFDRSGEISLFREEKKESLYDAIDAIKKRFGEASLTKAQLISCPVSKSR